MSDYAKKYKKILEQIKYQDKEKYKKKDDHTLKKLFINELEQVKSGQNLSEQDYIVNEIKLEKEKIEKLKYLMENPIEANNEKKLSIIRDKSNSEKISKNNFFYYYNKFQKNNKKYYSALNVYNKYQRSRRLNSGISYNSNVSCRKKKEKVVILPPIITQPENVSFSSFSSNGVDDSILKKENVKSNDIRRNYIESRNNRNNINHNLRSSNLSQDSKISLNKYNCFSPPSLPYIGYDLVERINNIKNSSEDNYKNIYLESEKGNKIFEKEKNEYSYLKNNFK